MEPLHILYGVLSVETGKGWEELHARKANVPGLLGETARRVYLLQPQGQPHKGPSAEVRRIGQREREIACAAGQAESNTRDTLFALSEINEECRGLLQRFGGEHFVSTVPRTIKSHES